MTEEIIDGVDVSGCKYFQIAANTIYPKAHYCGSTFNRFCEDDENCVYKQLKRLEQENNLLKKISTSLTDNNLFSARHFEQENAKLKELLETRCYNEVEFENKKLKEKLEKIRKYANQLKVFTHIKEDLLNIIEGAEDE